MIEIWRFFLIISTDSFFPLAKAPSTPGKVIRSTKSALYFCFRNSIIGSWVRPSMQLIQVTNFGIVFTFNLKNLTFTNTFIKFRPKEQIGRKIGMVDVEKIREEIVEIARGIFAKFGFKKTSMDEIAKAVRKAKSSLYYYFQSKEEVFQAVIEREANVFREKISKALEGVKDPQEKLRAYVITRMKMIKQLSNFYSALSDEYLENFKFIEKFREKYDEEESNAIAGILKEGIEKKIFKIKDIEMTTLAILIALKGFETWIFKGNVKWSESDLDNLLDILFYGIVRK